MKQVGVSKQWLYLPVFDDGDDGGDVNRLNRLVYINL